MSDDITAGRYEVVCEQWDEILSKPNEPLDFVRHVKGDLVDLDVAEARRLLKAGAVVEPGARERAAAQAARMQYEAALAALPTAVRDQVLGNVADGEGGEGGEGDKPRTVEAKGTWVAYAVSQGMTSEEAEALTKDQLVERFREA